MVNQSTQPRHRSFGKRKNVETTPLTFDLLDGKYSFEAKARLQGAVILDFVEMSSENEAGAAHLTKFILQALKDDAERTRFSEVIRSDDPEDVIDIEELGDLVAWLIEEYTSRPTQGSSE